jgi:hypothetical protein
MSIAQSLTPYPWFAWQVRIARTIALAIWTLSGRTAASATEEAPASRTSTLARTIGFLVTGNANGGLSVQPLDRRISYRTCRAHDVVAHRAKRGRPRQTSEPLEPSPLQLGLDTTIRD